MVSKFRDISCTKLNPVKQTAENYKNEFAKKNISCFITFNYDFKTRSGYDVSICNMRI